VSRLNAIHQMVADLHFGDAIGNDARRIRDALRSWGYRSDLLASTLDTESASEGALYHSYHGLDLPGTGVILHHSIGGRVADAALRSRSKRMMIYHNITPAEFFEPYHEDMARLIRKGRLELLLMRGRFALAAADSEYNAAELRALHYENVHVLPIIIAYEQLDLPACPRALAALQGPERKVVFVGRIAPNKKQDDLVRAFACYQRISPRSRLYLVGQYLPDERYYHAVQQAIHDTGAIGVVLTGKVSQAELNAYYQKADLFVSMSEHEGFGVPLVEAMHFGIPVLAYKCTAVPETMGDAGVLFTEKRYPELAEMMDLLIEDQGLRERVIAGQRRRLPAFQPASLLARLREVIEEFERA